MIVVFTDFGWTGPYVGQMKAVLAALAPGAPVIDLMHDAPMFAPRPAAYLLAALAERLPAGAVVLGVVDPGVGTRRHPVVVQAGGRRYVGPDNGLFSQVARRAGPAAAWRIDWRPPALSATFHGRDLFAPVAAMLATGAAPPGPPLAPDSVDRPDWPDELPEVVYVDHYGNAMTGLRATALGAGAALAVQGRVMPRARTFGDVPPGTPFWYENSIGLAEIAVAQGSAASALGLAVGAPVEVCYETAR